ncbi:hypothetical protein [Marinovum algicola]|uniref:hypothetical protein n=1 Tax=Marinovum algicola TaxID=42444 RepID=UPI003529EB37
MTVQYAQSAGHTNWLAETMIRLRDRSTGEYLHLSGAGRTLDVTWSWLGTRQQARTLRDRALTLGEDWPWRAVRRDEEDRK